MVQVVERSSPMRDSGILSEAVIPAVPGEFYSYSSRFTKDQPLYVFMKCKANKARSLASAIELESECNLVFRFGEYPRVCSIKTAHSSGLLGESTNNELFGETWIAVTEITTKNFYNLRSWKNVDALVKTCHVACSKREVSAELNQGVVIAFVTDIGKYGMFVVKELTSESIDIDAWHILL